MALLAAVLLMASRVGERARFVTWPIVAFTVLSAAVALIGLWVGLERPRLLAAGVLPALVLSYVLPAAPIAFVAVVLVVLGGLALRVRGMAAGIAMTVGILMVAAVAAQGPAVECGDTSVSSGSGPWWIPATSGSSSSTGDASGGFAGSTRVGDHDYVFRCDGDRLVEFERAD